MYNLASSISLEALVLWGSPRLGWFVAFCSAVIIVLSSTAAIHEDPSVAPSISVSVSHLTWFKWSNLISAGIDPSVPLLCLFRPRTKSKHRKQNPRVLFSTLPGCWNREQLRNFKLNLSQTIYFLPVEVKIVNFANQAETQQTADRLLNKDRKWKFVHRSLDPRQMQTHQTDKLRAPTYEKTSHNTYTVRKFWTGELQQASIGFETDASTISEVLASLRQGATLFLPCILLPIAA